MISEKTKRLMSKAQTGRKHSKATKDKIRLAKLGKKRKPFSKKHKLNLSRAKIGNTNSLGFKHGKIIKEFHRKKMLGNSYHLGVKHTEATKKRIREASLGKKGNNWQGGITKVATSIRNSARYKKWRDAIFLRDDYTCQKCKKRGVYLEAHHKKSFSFLLKKYIITNNKEAIECKELWNLDNGKTLCLDCHKLTNNYKQKANVTKNKSIIS